jgi:hypothetical protein
MRTRLRGVRDHVGVKGFVMCKSPFSFAVRLEPRRLSRR